MRSARDEMSKHPKLPKLPPSHRLNHIQEPRKTIPLLLNGQLSCGVVDLLVYGGGTVKVGLLFSG